MIIDNRNIAVFFDDHKLFSDSFSALIERLGIFHSVHTLDSEHHLVQFLIQHHNAPVYLFLDFYLAEKHSLPLINEARRMNKHIRIIMISSVTNPSTISHILSYRPDAFISKTSGLDTVLGCVGAASRGQTFLCPVISEIVERGDDTDKVPFTAREMDMLYHFSQGLSIQETVDSPPSASTPWWPTDDG